MISENEVSNLKTIDCLQGKNLKIDCLDIGFVSLVDCLPRLVPENRTLEIAIAKSARISFGRSTSSVTQDNALVRRLIKDRHTSPLEGVKFTFHIKCPKFIAIQFLRHRTFCFNELSQRYTQVKDEFFSPLKNSIRENSKTNKQSSQEFQDQSKLEEAQFLFSDIDRDLEGILQKYKQLLELGVARELARYCLPMGIYTELVFTVDLNNLLKFLDLRMAPDAQYEIQVYARAMYELVKPLIPNVCEIYQEMKNGIFLSAKEIEAIKNNTSLESKIDNENLQKKKNLLGFN